MVLLTFGLLNLLNGSNTVGFWLSGGGDRTPPPSGERPPPSPLNVPPGGYFVSRTRLHKIKSNFHVNQGG